MSGTAPFPAPNTTLGAVEIGFVCSTFLFGIETLQLFNYYRNYTKDPTLLRVVVAIIWLGGVGHTICGWGGIYQITVTYYGQPHYIFDPPKILGFLTLFSSWPSLLIQSFYCVRIARLSHRRVFPILLNIFCGISTIVTIPILVLFLKNGGFPALETGMGRKLLLLTTALIPTAHILLAATLCYYLWKFRKTNEWAKTQNVIDQLILWTIETTGAATFVAIMYMAMYLTRPDLVWMAFYVVHPKVLSNTMLASLNNRNPTGSTGFTDDASSHAHAAHIHTFRSAGQTNFRLRTLPDSALGHEPSTDADGDMTFDAAAMDKKAERMV